MDEYLGSKFPQWIDNIVFKDEIIKSVKPGKFTALPPLLKQARSLERSRQWKSREELFFYEAKLLADYEDNYEYKGLSYTYYPVYRTMKNAELRGYFSWRTKVRHGIFVPAFETFIYLYAYELINQIGVKTPEEGYAKLFEIFREYKSTGYTISTNLNKWLIDYVVYYTLDASLLAGLDTIIRDQCLSVFCNIDNQTTDQIIAALKHLGSRWLKRSKFYAAHQEDMDNVIARVFRILFQHHSEAYKNKWVEQFITPPQIHSIDLFRGSIFYNPHIYKDYKYEVNDQRIYKCLNGNWSIRIRMFSLDAFHRLDSLLKTLDSKMREACFYGHPIKEEYLPEWIGQIIQAEIKSFLSEKKEAKKIIIDYTQLEEIRKNAVITQEKLIAVEDYAGYMESESCCESNLPNDHISNHMQLNPVEYRLLQCLLYDKDIGWVKQNGYLLSVIVNAINEKLYDVFNDSVIDDSPELVEEYIEDLKGIVHI